MTLDLVKNVVGNSRHIFPDWKNFDPTSSPDADFIAANISESALDIELLTLGYTASDLLVLNRNDKAFALRTAFDNGTWTP